MLRFRGPILGIIAALFAGASVLEASMIAPPPHGRGELGAWQAVKGVAGENTVAAVGVMGRTEWAVPECRITGDTGDRVELGVDPAGWKEALEEGEKSVVEMRWLPGVPTAEEAGVGESAWSGLVGGGWALADDEGGGWEGMPLVVAQVP